MYRVEYLVFAAQHQFVRVVPDLLQVFLENNALLAHLTGTSDVIQVVSSKFNEFQYTFWIPRHLTITTSRPSRH